MEVFTSILISSILTVTGLYYVVNDNQGSVDFDLKTEVAIANDRIKEVGGLLVGAKTHQTLPRSADILPPNKENDFKEINLDCEAAVAYDLRTGAVLYGKNEKKLLPIASITKLMAALVFLDYYPDFNKIYEIKNEDKVEGGKINLFPGEKVRVMDLFYSSLVASDNMAIIAMIHSLGIKEEDFVKKMNEKAAWLGLENTSFKDPVGLSDNNISTSLDLARLTQEAVLRKEIAKATTLKEYNFSTLEGRKKIMYATNELIDVYSKNKIDMVGGKTGFTEAAGGCLTGQFSDREGNEVITVVLGGKNREARFSQTSKLVDWVYNNYQWN